MNDFAKRVFQKIKDKQDLDYCELQFIERAFVLQSVQEELLNQQLGITPNTFNLENVDK